MLRIKFLFVALLTYSAIAFSQNLKITIKGFPNQTAILTKVEGDMYVIKDTLFSNAAGIIQYPHTMKLSTGIYYVIIPQMQHAKFPFIYDDSQITIQTTLVGMQKDVTVLESNQNKAYYNFLHLQNTVEGDIKILEYAFNNYSDTVFKKSIQAEYSKKLQDFTLQTQSILKTCEGTFAWHIIKSSPKVYPPNILNDSDKNIYLRKHYLDNIDFADTVLLRSEIFSNSSIEYLGLYTQLFNTSQKKEILKQAVTVILQKAQAHKKVFDYVVDYLMNGFESMGDADLITFISEYYLEQYSCSDMQNPTTIERRALQSTQFKVGSKAPNFSVTDLNGSIVSNESISKKPTVIVFWATWCEHCAQMVPIILEEYSKTDEYNLVMVSVDDNPELIKEYIKNQPYAKKATHICEGKLWDGEMAKAFYVFGTPSIFIIKDNTIFAKPIEMHQYIQDTQNAVKK